MNHCSSKSLSPVGQSVDEHCVPLCLDDEVKTKCGSHTVLRDSILHNTGCQHTNVYLKLASRGQFLAKRSILLHSNRYRMSLKSCCETNRKHTGEILKVDSIRWNIKTLSVIMDHWLAVLLKHTIAAHCRPCHSLLRFEYERNNICANIFGSWSLVTDVITGTFKPKCCFY